jgi:hypothetical protein
MFNIRTADVFNNVQRGAVLVISLCVTISLHIMGKVQTYAWDFVEPIDNIPLPEVEAN